MATSPTRAATLRRAALALALAAPLALPAAELGADLDGLLAHARARSPELAAMRHESEAADQRVQPAGALPDPVFRVELMNVNNDGNPGGFNLLPSKVGETQYTLMQMIPLGGKRELRRGIAQADAQQAHARVDLAWTELAMKIKTAYAQYAAAAGNQRLLREVLGLMAQLEQLAQARYASGLVAQQDAVRAQLEQTAMRTELLMLDNDRRQARARLNALLGRSPDESLAEPQALRPLPAAALDLGTLALRVRAANPAIQAEQARIRSAEQARDLARSNRIPDLQVGISPTQMGSRLTRWGLMFEINIPLQRESLRSMSAESEAMLAAQRARTDAVTIQLVGELGEHLAAIDAAQRTEALLTNQLLPQSELALRSAVAAYENGKVDFATLLDAQRQIRKAQQDRLKVQVEAQMRLAEIERIVGGEL